MRAAAAAAGGVLWALTALCCAGVAAAQAIDAAAGPASASSAPVDDAVRYVQFVEDNAATCVSRNGVEVLVKNTHPTRSLRVWLDRYHMGVGTGDRSRSDLAPGAEPEPLGCSKTFTGAQEWRLVRAVFIN